MKQDQPAAHDLAGTVRAYLEDLTGKVDAEHRFDLKVAVHLLGIVERELRDRPDFDDTERAELESLLGIGKDEDEIAALCRAIRAGDLDDRWDEALKTVTRSVELKMQVVRPEALGKGRQGES